MSKFNKIRAPQKKVTRLVAAAIIRDGVVESRGFKSHYLIRAALGDKDPSQKHPGDVEGFLTSEEKFVTREEALAIGIASGQLSIRYVGLQRDLLSSDIDW